MSKKGCNGSCKGGRHAAMKKVMSPKTKGAKFPTLGDFKATVPAGGLLNPDLKRPIRLPRKQDVF